MWSQLFSPERRREPRYQANLRVVVSFLGTAAAGEQPLAVLGRTRDLSARGVALYVPAFPFTTGDLTEARRALSLLLAFPTGDIAAAAMLVRYEPLPARHAEVGYLLAARLTLHSDAERRLYSDYLKQIAAGLHL